MNRIDRLALLEARLDTFLSRSRDEGYIVFEVVGARDQYVQLLLHDGLVYGEVGSRHWNGPERALTGPAVDRLAQLGFTGGGPEKNYSKDELPTATAELALLTDTLLRTAYELDDDYTAEMAAMDLKVSARRVTLRDEASGPDHRSLWAHIDDGGNLRISGQDLGPRTAPVSSDGEYEWCNTISAVDVPRLLVLLGAPPDADVLDVLEADWSGTRAGELEMLLASSDIHVERFVQSG